MLCAVQIAVHGLKWRLLRGMASSEGSGVVVGIMRTTAHKRKGSRWWDLNPRPTVYETVALPLSYIGVGQTCWHACQEAGGR